MNVNDICSNIEELFCDTVSTEDLREYYYMLRQTLDNSFAVAYENLIKTRYNIEE